MLILYGMPNSRIIIRFIWPNIVNTKAMSNFLRNVFLRYNNSNTADIRKLPKATSLIQLKFPSVREEFRELRHCYCYCHCIMRRLEIELMRTHLLIYIYIYTMVRPRKTNSRDETDCFLGLRFDDFDVSPPFHQIRF